MEKDLKDLIKELSEGVDTIFMMNPDDVKKLEDIGIPVEIVHKKEIDDLIRESIETVSEIKMKLPSTPDEFPSPSIEYIYQEIQKCILFGINGAAITLCGILIEVALKHTTYIAEMGEYGKHDLEKLEEIENMDLAKSISRAKGERARILESKPAKEIDFFREKIRNPYIHYNIKEITKGTLVEGVKDFNLEAIQYEEKDILADDDVNIQFHVKPIIDEDNAIHIFKKADSVVKYLIRKLNEKLMQEEQNKTMT